MSVSVDLGASAAGEVLLSHVNARAVEPVCLLMTDLLDLETLMKVIPSGIDDRALRNPSADESNGLAFGIKTAGSELRPRTELSQ